MMRFVRLLIFVLIFYTTTCALELKIIVHKNNPLEWIRSRDLKALFLKQIEKVQGYNLEVIEYRFDDNLRQSFALRFLNMNQNQLELFWRNRLLTVGQQDPQTKKNHKVLVNYIAHHPEAIGYCSETVKLPENVKVIPVRHY